MASQGQVLEQMAANNGQKRRKKYTLKNKCFKIYLYK
jgi:hypothetical protein